MYTSISCGFTGAFFQAGGIGAAIWVLLRTIWLHIRIFWDRNPGPLFIWISLFIGIIIPALFLGITIAVSGFSYRFGKICLLNHQNSFAVFWGWLIGLGVAAFLVQTVTTAYCIYVYWSASRLRSTAAKSNDTNTSKTSKTAADEAEKGNGSGSNSTAKPPPKKAKVGFDESAISKAATRQRWRHIRRIFILQWRSFALTIALVVESIYFATVFWAEEVKYEHASTNPAAAVWGECLVFNQGNKTACLSEANAMTLGQNYFLGSLMLAALVGVECVLLITRSSILVGWWDLFTHPMIFCRERWGGAKPYDIPTQGQTGTAAGNESQAQATLPLHRPTLAEAQAADPNAAAALMSPHSSSIARGFAADEERAIGLRPIPPRPPRPNMIPRKAVAKKEGGVDSAKRVDGPSFIEAMRNGLGMNPVMMFASQPTSRAPGAKAQQSEIPKSPGPPPPVPTEGSSGADGDKNEEAAAAATAKKDDSSPVGNGAFEGLARRASKRAHARGASIGSDTMKELPPVDASSIGKAGVEAVASRVSKRAHVRGGSGGSDTMKELPPDPGRLLEPRPPPAPPGQPELPAPPAPPAPPQTSEKAEDKGRAKEDESLKLRPESMTLTSAWQTDSSAYATEDEADETEARRGLSPVVRPESPVQPQGGRGDEGKGNWEEKKGDGKDGGDIDTAF
jgi:hypothetical protein